MKTIFLYRVRTSTWLLLLLALCLPSMQLLAQQGKNGLRIADEYFANGEYLTAAYLYAQLLHPVKQSRPVSDFPVNVKRKRAAVNTNSQAVSAIIFKQAESYRLSNYWEAAADCYSKCIDKNDPHLAEASYWLAVCHRNLGNYGQAESVLNELLKDRKATGVYEKPAMEELKRLAYISNELKRPDTALFTVQKLQLAFGEEKGAFAPAYIKGKQFLISSTVKDSLVKNGINPYKSRLFLGNIVDLKMSEYESLSFPTAGPQDNQGAASISADGKHLYYTQWKIEKGQTSSAIYYAIKNNGSWGAAKLVPSVNITGYNSKQPFCSPDGKWLYFSTDRPGGSGKFDIWYAPLNKDGSTGKPINAGRIINTPADEVAPFYHAYSASLVFASNAAEGMGGYDFFVAKRNESTWKQAENMGYPVNSVRDDLYFFAPENAPLLTNAIISSDRGTGCCLQSYHLVKAEKKQQVSGFLRLRKDSTPVSNTVIHLKNGSGKTKEIITDADGKYVIDGLNAYADWILKIDKESYQPVASHITPKFFNQQDKLVDELVNEDIYLEEIVSIKAEDIITVYFDFDRSDLRQETIAKLDSIYKDLVQLPTAVIQISGYADNSGSQTYNIKLSDKRAKACADYLVGKGIDRNRISFESFGSCCPVVMEQIDQRDKKDHGSLDRRALIHVKKR